LTVILDYGMGNLRSVEKAVEFIGYPVRVQSNLDNVTKLIIPGVGAFGAAMERLSPLRGEIVALAQSGIPIFGICLGQQLLFERSEEMGEHNGLGLIAGEVLYLPRDLGLKVPHVGWSPLTPVQPTGPTAGIKAGEQVYFVHSLYTRCDDPSDIAATAQYGLVFPAAVRRANVWGCQFHPEKSGDVGLRILRNFMEC
jgi:imidazole glycerol-phosphate synthase subunit HisH